MTLAGLVTVDWLIVSVCLVAALGGYRLGFITRAASWVGMAGGIFLAVKLLPPLLKNAHQMSDVNKLGIAILLILLGSMLGQVVGLFAGSKISASIPADGPIYVMDRIAGGLAGVTGVLVALWLMLPMAANVPGWSAQLVRSSAIAQALYNNTPKPPDAMLTLKRLVGSGAFPSVFEDIRQAPDSGPPPGDLAIDEAVVETVRLSTVKVEGIACHRTQNGSGFVIGPELIATNAHVVAGEAKTSVVDVKGKTYSAVPVAFDSARDLAILRVPKFAANPLLMAAPKVNDTGAVFGHPGGQEELAITPAAVRREITAVGRDLYDKQTTRREVLILAAQLHQGDSGGALIDKHGQVIGVAFAIAPDRPGTSYALNTSELRAALDQVGAEAVDTGSCLTE